MGFRFQRRISLGGGLGLNFSGARVSVSRRGRWGGIGSGGVSFRTGIPGLSYRQGTGSGGALELMVGLVSFILSILLMVSQVGVLLLGFFIRTLCGVAIALLALTWELLTWLILTAADLFTYCRKSWLARRWL